MQYSAMRKRHRLRCVEEPLNATDILSYQDKYMSGGKSAKSGAKGGMSSLARRCPADIPEELTRRVQELAVATFQALGCLGVSRIDFLNDRETGELWVNEINTIPGSLAFYLWKPPVCRLPSCSTGCSPSRSSGSVSARR